MSTIAELRKALELLEEVEGNLWGLDIENFERLKKKVDGLSKDIVKELAWRERAAMQVLTGEIESPVYEQLIVRIYPPVGV
jgi:hypothetical protein